MSDTASADATWVPTDEHVCGAVGGHVSQMGTIQACSSASPNTGSDGIGCAACEYGILRERITCSLREHVLPHDFLRPRSYHRWQNELMRNRSSTRRHQLSRPALSSVCNHKALSTQASEINPGDESLETDQKQPEETILEEDRSSNDAGNLKIAQSVAANTLSGHASDELHSDRREGEENTKMDYTVNHSIQHSPGKVGDHDPEWSPQWSDDEKTNSSLRAPSTFSAVDEAPSSPTKAQRPRQIPQTPQKEQDCESYDSLTPLPPPPGMVWLQSLGYARIRLDATPGQTLNPKPVSTAPQGISHEIDKGSSLRIHVRSTSQDRTSNIGKPRTPIKICSPHSALPVTLKLNALSSTTAQAIQQGQSCDHLPRSRTSQTQELEKPVKPQPTLHEGKTESTGKPSILHRLLSKIPGLNKSSPRTIETRLERTLQNRRVPTLVIEPRDDDAENSSLASNDDVTYTQLMSARSAWAIEHSFEPKSPRGQPLPKPECKFSGTAGDTPQAYQSIRRLQDGFSDPAGSERNASSPSRISVRDILGTIADYETNTRTRSELIVEFSGSEASITPTHSIGLNFSMGFPSRPNSTRSCTNAAIDGSTPGGTDTREPRKSDSRADLSYRLRPEQLSTGEFRSSRIRGHGMLVASPHANSAASQPRKEDSVLTGTYALSQSQSPTEDLMGLLALAPSPRMSAPSEE